MSNEYVQQVEEPMELPKDPIADLEVSPAEPQEVKKAVNNLKEMTLISPVTYMDFTIPTGDYKVFERGENGYVIEHGPLTLTISSDDYKALFLCFMVDKKEYDSLVKTSGVLSLVTELGVKEVCVTGIQYDKDAHTGIINVKEIPQK